MHGNINEKISCGPSSGDHFSSSPELFQCLCKQFYFKYKKESNQPNANQQSQNMYSEPNNSSQQSNASENETVDKKIA